MDFRAAVNAQQYEVDMSASVQILGLLHILHNATNDLHNAMSWWGRYVQHLCSVSRLLTKGHLRQRFLSTCCCNYPWSLQHHLAEQFQAPVHLARWGTVAAATEALHDPLIQMLRQCWSKAKFTFNQTEDVQVERVLVEGEDVPPAEHEHQAIHEAITSAQFWGYRAMFSELASCIRSLMEWVESCPCHYSKDIRYAQSGAKRRRWFQAHMKSRLSSSSSSSSSCVLRTRRAPEIAAGCFDDIFKVLFDTSAALLVSRLQANLTPLESQVILGDWESGRQALALTLTVKLAAWRRLPLLLAGAAHHDEALARSMMAKAVETISVRPSWM